MCERCFFFVLLSRFSPSALAKWLAHTLAHLSLFALSCTVCWYKIQPADNSHLHPMGEGGTQQRIESGLHVGVKNSIFYDCGEL